MWSSKYRASANSPTPSRSKISGNVPRRYWFPQHYASGVQRLRVPLGFLLIAAFFLLAAPNRATLILGLPIALVGLAIRGWAAGHLAKDRSLATGGPYAFVRNPLYLGSLISAIGFALASGVWWLPLAFALVFSLVYLPVMELEEQHLLKLFPGSAEYVERVPLILPLRSPIPSASRFETAQYLKNEEYKALAALLVAGSYLAWRAGLFGR